MQTSQITEDTPCYGHGCRWLLRLAACPFLTLALRAFTRRST